MGFFKSIGKAITSVVKQPAKAVSSLVRTVVNDPVRAAAAVATTGLSEVARATPVIGDFVKAGTQAASGVYSTAANVYTGGLYGQASNLAQGILSPKEQPMAFNVGQFLGGVSSVFGGSSNPYLSNVGQVANIAGSFFQPQAQVPSYSQPQVVYASQQQTSGVPAVRGGGVPMTREIFEAGAKVFARLGHRVPANVGGFSSALKRILGSLASLARRTPAGTLVSLLGGVGLAVTEANLLTAWFAQKKRHRRMNPANSKALRRACRRIKSFRKLCHTADTLTASRRSYSKKCR